MRTPLVPCMVHLLSSRIVGAHDDALVLGEVMMTTAGALPTVLVEASLSGAASARIHNSSCTLAPHPEPSPSRGPSDYRRRTALRAVCNTCGKACPSWNATDEGAHTWRTALRVTHNSWRKPGRWMCEREPLEGSYIRHILRWVGCSNRCQPQAHACCAQWQCGCWAERTGRMSLFFCR